MAEPLHDYNYLMKPITHRSFCEDATSMLTMIHYFVLDGACKLWQLLPLPYGLWLKFQVESIPDQT